MASWMQGVFKPQNPSKYKGNVNNIVYRSSWELTYLMRLDTDPNVLRYSSEETIIPYRLPGSPAVRRYFVDFWVEKKVGDKVVQQLIEIKPHTQTLPPKVRKGQKKSTALREQMTYIMNQEKWKAANKYCEKKGWDFIVLSEQDLGR